MLVFFFCEKACLSNVSLIRWQFSKRKQKNVATFSSRRGDNSAAARSHSLRFIGAIDKVANGPLEIRSSSRNGPWKNVQQYFPCVSKIVSNK